jgi:hypothetical protein
MCKVLKISRSTHYKHLNKQPSKREIKNEKLKKQTLEIYEECNKTYGTPRIYKTLIGNIIVISLKRV